MAVSLQQLMANNTPQPWTQHAGGSLMQAMFGNTEPARMAGYSQGVRLAALLEGAKRKRDENLGFAAITPQALVADGVDPSRAPLVSAMLHAGSNLAQLGTYQKDQQAIDWGNQTWANANGAKPDLNLLMRQNMVRGDKVVPLTRIEDHTTLNPYVTPDQQTLTPTQVGLADIMAAKARANASNAIARLHDTQTAAGGWNPNTGTHNKPYWPGFSALEKINTHQVPTNTSTGLTTYQDKLDINALKEMLEWRAAHPKMSFADYEQQHQAPTLAPSAPVVGVSSPQVLSDAGMLGASPLASPHGEVVKTGTFNGRHVVKYADGTIEYADQ